LACHAVLVEQGDPEMILSGLCGVIGFFLGIVCVETRHYLRTYLKQRAEERARSASYAERLSETVHTRLTEYGEHLLLDELICLSSVHARLAEIVAVLEKRLPDPQEAQDMKKELASVATEMRSIRSKLGIHSGIYDETLRRKLGQVGQRLKKLVDATEDLANRVTVVEDETTEEFLRDSLEIFKKQLDTFEVALSALGRTIRDATTPQAIVRQDRKRLT